MIAAVIGEATPEAHCKLLHLGKMMMVVHHAIVVEGKLLHRTLILPKYDKY